MGVCDEGRRPLGVLDSEVEGTGLSELLPWKQESRLFVFLGAQLFYLNTPKRKHKTGFGILRRMGFVFLEADETEAAGGQIRSGGQWPLTQRDAARQVQFLS